jgi:hypothetical protein
MVSCLYNNINVLKCNDTLAAIKNWISKELKKKEITKIYKYKNI